MSAARRRRLRYDDLEIQAVLRAASSILEKSVHSRRVAERQNHLAVRERKDMYGGWEREGHTAASNAHTLNPRNIESQSKGASPCREVVPTFWTRKKNRGVRGAPWIFVFQAPQKCQHRSFEGLYRRILNAKMPTSSRRTRSPGRAATVLAPGRTPSI